MRTTLKVVRFIDQTVVYAKFDFLVIDYVAPLKTYLRCKQLADNDDART